MFGNSDETIFLMFDISLIPLQKLEELEKEEELREQAGLYDSEPVSNILT